MSFCADFRYRSEVNSPPRIDTKEKLNRGWTQIDADKDRTSREWTRINANRSEGRCIRRSQLIRVSTLWAGSGTAFGEMRRPGTRDAARSEDLKDVQFTLPGPVARGASKYHRANTIQGVASLHASYLEEVYSVDTRLSCECRMQRPSDQFAFIRVHSRFILSLSASICVHLRWGFLSGARSLLLLVVLACCQIQLFESPMQSATTNSELLGGLGAISASFFQCPQNEAHLVVMYVHLSGLLIKAG
jgi:hypothetical protein